MMPLGPCVPANDVADDGLRNSIFHAKSLLANPARGITFPYFVNLYRRQFRAWVVLATEPTAACTPFAHHVLNVIGLGPKKEMRWIDAWRVIAAMKNTLSFLKRTVRDLPRNPVRQGHASASNPKEAVALPVACPAPYPAFARSVYFRPEALIHSSHYSKVAMP